MVESQTRLPRLRRVVALVAVLVVALIAGCAVSEERVDYPAGSAVAKPTAPADAPEPTPLPATPTPAPTPDPRPPVFEPDRAPATEFSETWSAPLEVDPAVLQGELDNGVDYMVQANNRPGAQAELRLVIGAGSIHEDLGALGSAHFLEHMMFNGTEMFPDNEIIKVLESFGAGFGPDVNAYTSYEETVYELTVPTDDQAAIDLGLAVLVQWATAATISEAAVDAERGVIREEYRRRAETMSGRRLDALRAVKYADTIFADRAPIGTAEAIETIDAADLRDFYERWYRPDNISVIAVGDFDAGAMRDRIVAAFGDLAAPATDPAPTDDGVDGFETRQGLILEDPEISTTTVDVSWRFAGTRPSDVKSTALLHDRTVTDLALTLIDARLFEDVHRGDLYLAAGAGQGWFPGYRSLAAVDAVGDAEDLADMVRALLTTVEQVRQHGVTQAEWDRAIASMRSLVDQAYAESATSQDSAIAETLVGFTLGEMAPLDADMALAVRHEVIDSLTIEQVERRLDEWLASEPFIFVSTNGDELTSIEDLFQVYDEVVGRQVPEPDRSGQAGVETLMERPEASAITGHETVAALDATVVNYANGVRMAYRNTPVVDNSVEFRAWSRGGFFQEEPDQAPLVEMAADLVMASGFESIDIVELDRLVSSRIVNFGGNVARASESLNGSASTVDLETLFQLIHLQFTESTVTQSALRRHDERLRPLIVDPALNPSVAGTEAMWRLRYGDSPYFRYLPALDELDRLDAETALAGWERRFANPADFLFVFVGDIDPAVLEDLGARYLGTLETTPDRESAIDRDPGIPPDNLVQVVQAGVGDKGRVRINWESPYPDTFENQVAAEALEIVVNARLRDLIRERLGASYSPRAVVSVLDEPKDWIDTIIEVEGDPDRLAEISTVIHDELARLRAGDLDPSYLDRAVDQLDHGYRFFSNSDWIEAITDAIVDTDSDPAGVWRRRALAQALTVADLARTAQVTFPPQRSVEIQLVPAPD